MTEIRDQQVLLDDGPWVPVEAVRVLPDSGAKVMLWGDEFRWISTRSFDGDQLRVEVFNGRTVEERLVRPEVLVLKEEPRPEEVEMFAAMGELFRQAARTRQLERWRDSLVENAHEWADDNDLCTRFDDFMEEHGLPRRSKDYDVRITVTLHTYVHATDWEEVERIVDEAFVAQLLSNDSYTYDVEEDDD